MTLKKRFETALSNLKVKKKEREAVWNLILAGYEGNGDYYSLKNLEHIYSKAMLFGQELTDNQAIALVLKDIELTGIKIRKEREEVFNDYLEKLKEYGLSAKSVREIKKCLDLTIIDDQLVDMIVNGGWQIRRAKADYVAGKKEPYLLFELEIMPFAFITEELEYFNRLRYNEFSKVFEGFGYELHMRKLYKDLQGNMPLFMNPKLSMEYQGKLNRNLKHFKKRLKRGVYV